MGVAAAAFRGLSAGRMPASHGTARLADVPYCQRRDGPPQLVIRRKHPVVAMPVLPRRRDEIGEPVEELKRREPDDAISSRPRRRPPAQLAGVSTPGPGVAPSLARATLVIENGSIHGGRPVEVPLAGLSLKYSGYWPQKRKALLKHFGNSIDAIKQASAEDLMQVDGINEKLAETIIVGLN